MVLKNFELGQRRMSKSKAILTLNIIQGVNDASKLFTEYCHNLINVVGSPDDVPRRRTGKLAESASPKEGKGFGKLRVEGDKIARYVGVNADNPIDEIGYSVYLEFGTSRMKPRPFVTKTFIATKPKITKLMEKATIKTLQQISRS